MCFSCSSQNNASRNPWPFAAMRTNFAAAILCNRKKVESTRCSKHMHKGKDSKNSPQRDKYSLQRVPKARLAQKSKSRANMVRAEQTNSQSKTVQVEQSIIGHGRPNNAREEHTCRADKDTVLQIKQNLTRTEQYNRAE